PAGGLSSAPYGTLFGKPVIPCEQAATLGTAGDIILADLSQYLMIDKGSLQSASSIHVKFTTDETAFRFTYRCDGQPLWKTVLTPYKGTGNTQSPFIVLNSTRT
ncbi:MAG TPA: phage major capsid protein, partial [Dehalococcoidia bacterium]